MDNDLHSDQFDFIVVGGGCIAASTVYAIKKKWPAARVAWYMGVHEHTASNDFLKIIRDAYPDNTMAEWANRAMQLWSSDELLSKHFHWTAWIQAIDKETTKTMSKGQKDKAVTAKEMMEVTRERCDVWQYFVNAFSKWIWTQVFSVTGCSHKPSSPSP